MSPFIFVVVSVVAFVARAHTVAHAASQDSVTWDAGAFMAAMTVRNHGFYEFGVIWRVIRIFGGVHTGLFFELQWV